MPKEIKSKYQAKTLIDHGEPRLLTTQHKSDPYCNGIFAVDYRWLKYEYDEEADQDYAVITCPYCGKQYREPQ